MNRKVIAALLSGLACPGAGQIYNRQYLKGAMFVLAVLGLISASVYRVWDAMFEMAMAMPGDQLEGSLYPLARKVVEANGPFITRTATAVAVLWVLSVIDAYIKAGKAAG